MNFSARSLFCTGLLAVVATAATTAPEPAAPLSISREIEGLLKRRLKPEPLPPDLPNPFVMSAKELKDSIVLQTTLAADSVAGQGVDAIKPVANADVLAEVISHLHFGGVIRMKDQVQIVINDIPRKEGDTVKAPWNNVQVLLRVQRISPVEVALRYLDVEATVRF